MQINHTGTSLEVATSLMIDGEWKEPDTLRYDLTGREINNPYRKRDYDTEQKHTLTRGEVDPQGRLLLWEKNSGSNRAISTTAEFVDGGNTLKWTETFTESGTVINDLYLKR